MKTEELIKRRRGQFSFKIITGLLPLLFVVPLSIGVSSLFRQLLGIELGSNVWYLFIFIMALTLLIYYGIGFFAGSLRLDGNIISILSRMDAVEQRALGAVLEEITAQEEKDKRNGK